MSRAAEYRLTGLVLGCVFLLVVPLILLAPALLGEVSFAALPRWALLTSGASAALGVWHLLTSALALEEDLASLTSYVQFDEAAPLVFPLVLFVGTRSVYRRLFMPAFVARLRWQARRRARLVVDIPLEKPNATENFLPTVPREP
jgi:hypothetical protein